MPKFDLNDPIFEGFDFERDFESKLPSGSIRDIPGLMQKDFSFGYFTNFTRISRYSSGYIGNIFGIPDYGVSNFAKNNLKSLFDKAGLVTPDIVNSLIAQGAALGIETALQAIFTNIPVVGNILQMGFRMFSLLISAVSKQQAPQNVPEEAKVYDGEKDQSLADFILLDLKNDDWTSIFLPTCGQSCSWSTSEVAWVGGVPGGRRFSVPEGFGRGLLPGIADQAGFYQYPYYDPGAFGLPTWLPRISTSGDLHPTTQQLSLLIWQSILKPSPNMFRIDFNAIQSAWRNYYGSLAEWGDSQNNTLLKFQAHSAASYAACLVENANYKWKDVCTKMSKSGCVQSTKTVDYTSVKGQLRCVGVLDQYKNIVGEQLPDAYWDPTFSMGELVRYIVSEYTKRLKPTLSTIVCAYVPPDAPAFKNVPGHLTDYYSDMRKLLLTHPAKSDVELDLIPDADYRNAMYTAKLQGGGGKISAGVVPRVVSGLPTIDPNPPRLPAAPPQGLPPGTPTPTVEHVRKNWLFYAAGLAALGYFGYRQNWPEKLRKVF